MSENVVYLHGHPREIAQYMRVGFLEHRQCEHLLAANKLGVRRYVIEAANFERQAGLVQTLKDKRAEIVLDTNAAELSVIGRFSGSAKAAPWAAEERPLEPDDFVSGTNRSVIDPIALFALGEGVSAVMAPAHYLGDGQAHWFSVDCNACIALREALDRLGGAHIVIDYPLILSYSQFRDTTFRRQIIQGLRDLPIDRLWLRVSGFGADATGSGIERYVHGMFAFHKLQRPVIADQVGGLASLAVCAFGASSGFAHGTEGKERFSAYGWVKSRGRASGGSGKTIYVDGLDRRLKVAEAYQLFDDSMTARAVLSCPDLSCCGDIDRMLSNPEAHLLVQKGRQVQDLSSTPESLRTDRFLTEHLEQSRHKADRATRLKKADDEMKAKIAKASKRLNRVEEALVSLHEQIGPVAFAEEARVRASGPRQTGFEGMRHE